MSMLFTKFRLYPSISLWTIFLLLHFGAAVSLYFIPVFYWVKIILMCSIRIIHIVIIRSYVFLSNNHSVVEVVFSDIRQEWYLKRRSGLLQLARLDYPLFISNYLIIANFILETGHKKVTLLISKDGLAEDSFRKIKKLLKKKIV